MGHQRLFKQAQSYKKKYNLKIGVINFNPMPKMFFNQSLKNFRLSSISQKISLLKNQNVDFIITKKFDKVYIFSSSLRYFLLAKLSGIKNILQYPLFRKKDNVVISAKIFTEDVVGEIVSTQPILNINNDKILKAKDIFKSLAEEASVSLNMKNRSNEILSIFP